MIKTNKGFSLVELVIALGIIIIMTGAAALYLGDIYFRAQVTKSLEDMETIGKALLLHDTENGANLFETELPAFVEVDAAWQEKDTLNNLVGIYLAVLPRDPWGGNYMVNSYAGWIASYAADYKIGGTSKYERDIKYYYLPENLFVTKVRVDDNDDNGSVSAGDSLTVYFSKSLRAYADAAGSTATAATRPANANGKFGTGANALSTLQPEIPVGTDGAEATGFFDVRDLVVVKPGALAPEADIAVLGAAQTGAWSRPNDTPFTYDRFSRELIHINMLDGVGETADVIEIGDSIVIPTGTTGTAAPWNAGQFGAGDNRGQKYMIWESTLGYVTGYKTPGQVSKLFLQTQAPEIAARTVLFKTLVD